MMGWGYGGGFWGFPLLMGVFWLALIALIIWLVFRLLPSSNKAQGPQTPGQPPAMGGTEESPEEFLDKMFARGEIDEQTYRSRRTALNDMRKQP